MRTKNQKQEIPFEGLPELPVEVSQNEIEPKDFLLRSLLSPAFFSSCCVRTEV